VKDPLNIHYLLSLKDGSERRFSVCLDGDSLESLSSPEDPPPWTELSFHRCPNCSLREQVHCPLALQLVEPVRLCSGLVSYEELLLRVETPERDFLRETSAQRAIASLMGLLIGASGCPHTTLFRPMARFHLPLSNEEETIYRATSMYMLAQYFAWQRGQSPDIHLEGLKQAYREMHIVNLHIAKRLWAVVKEDSSVNALILLDLFSKALPDTIADSLEEIRYLFEPFLRTQGIDLDDG